MKKPLYFKLDKSVAEISYGDILASEIKCFSNIMIILLKPLYFTIKRYLLHRQDSASDKKLCLVLFSTNILIQLLSI